jgi:succinate dehydrogenase / fumarate reductase flavoprotein subunit
MVKLPILTYPTQHYQNGGIVINEFGESEVRNLFAAGEVTGGVHGRNRLMGNSLLDILVFGRRAGTHAAKRAKEIDFGDVSLDHVKKFDREVRELDIHPDRRSPLILPDYRAKYVQKHQIPLFN